MQLTSAEINEAALVAMVISVDAMSWAFKAESRGVETVAEGLTPFKSLKSIERFIGRNSKRLAIVGAAVTTVEGVRFFLIERKNYEKINALLEARRQEILAAKSALESMKARPNS